MDSFLNELFGGEINNLKNHAKVIHIILYQNATINYYIQTEEEIKKYCTSEDFNELKRAVHLMKKGYEI